MQSTKRFGSPRSNQCKD